MMGGMFMNDWDDDTRMAWLVENYPALKELKANCTATLTDDQDILRQMMYRVYNGLSVVHHTNKMHTSLCKFPYSLEKLRKLLDGQGYTVD